METGYEKWFAKTRLKVSRRFQIFEVDFISHLRALSGSSLSPLYEYSWLKIKFHNLINKMWDINLYGISSINHMKPSNSNNYTVIIWFDDEILVLFFTVQLLNFTNMKYLATLRLILTTHLCESFLSFYVHWMIVISLDIHDGRLTIYIVRYDFGATFTAPLEIKLRFNIYPRTQGASRVCYFPK